MLLLDGVFLSKYAGKGQWRIYMGMHLPSDQEKRFTAEMQECRSSMITKCTGL
jgi:hypothetical protein